MRGLATAAQLTYEPPTPAPAGPTEGEEEGEDEETTEEPVEAPAEPPGAADAATARLEAWLAPFREVGRQGPVAERFRTVLASRRAQGPVAIDAWRLALELTPSPADRAAQPFITRSMCNENCEKKAP